MASAAVLCKIPEDDDDQRGFDPTENRKKRRLVGLYLLNALCPGCPDCGKDFFVQKRKEKKNAPPLDDDDDDVRIFTKMTFESVSS